jgi:hypothetical protein
LRWQLQWGPQITFLESLAEEAGFTPRALLDRPQLEPNNADLLVSFFDLSAQRGMGEVPQPIQYSEVLAYCELEGIYGSEYRAYLLSAVKALDAIFMEKVSDERKKASGDVALPQGSGHNPDMTKA